MYRFSNWVRKTLDSLLAEAFTKSGTPSRKALGFHVRLVDEWIGELRAARLAPGTINNYVKAVKLLYRVNGLKLEFPHRLSRRVVYPDRAPTPDQLAKILDLADLREKVIVSMLALGGFRVGTLCQLEYRHVKVDLEAGITPVCIEVEPQITKGGYTGYFTFIGWEAAEYLKAYLADRRRGSKRIPPEEIHDHSPLIRKEYSREPKPITPSMIHKVVNSLFKRAGFQGNLLAGRRYTYRPHSLRKFFKTNLVAAGVPSEFVEFWMGHVLDTYMDIRSKGIEYHRQLYAQAGLTIRPKTKPNLLETLKAIIRSQGENPEKYLVREVLNKPYRTILTEEDQVYILGQKIKELFAQEKWGIRQ